MLRHRLAVIIGHLFALLPFWLLYRLSDLLSLLLEWPFSYRQTVINQNLRRSFPDKMEAEIKELRKAFYRNFADIIVESIKSLHIRESALRKRFKLKNPEVFEKLRQQEKGVIMVMGHQCNFEWVAMAIPLCVKQPCFAVYHPLKNRRFNRTIVKIRQQFGLELFRMKNTYPFMLGNKADAPLYVFMADQSPHKGKIRYRTPFLNQNTPVHLGVENLSKKCDLAIVFLSIERVKRGHYLTEAELLFADAIHTEQYEITERHVAALESMIKNDPANWLWSHKRWKHAS